MSHKKNQQKTPTSMLGYLPSSANTFTLLVPFLFVTKLFFSAVCMALVPFMLKTW